MTATLEPLERIVSGGHGHDGEHGHHGPKTLPEAAVRYFAKKKLAKRIEDTTRSIHTDVYQTAEKKYLRNEDGEVDYSKLEKADIRKKMEDEIIEGYKSEAKRLGASFKKGATKDDINVVLNKYFRVTTDSIHSKFEEGEQTGDPYTAEAHEKNREEHLKLVKAELRGVTHSHFLSLEGKDIEDVLGYMGGAASEMFDKTAIKKNRAILGDLLELNRINKEQGVPLQLVQQSEELQKYLTVDYASKKVPTTNEEVEKQKKEHEKHAHGHTPAHN
ncbi:MAG TPA: hypothetical protein VJH88_04515 [Candidatus Nanoarchaeia archaeon]|nr:hypothetical protein [Candidatus Nanoarchaeia archaeon]